MQVLLHAGKIQLLWALRNGQYLQFVWRIREAYRLRFVVYIFGHGTLEFFFDKFTRVRLRNESALRIFCAKRYRLLLFHDYFLAEVLKIDISIVVFVRKLHHMVDLVFIQIAEVPQHSDELISVNLTLFFFVSWGEGLCKLVDLLTRKPDGLLVRFKRLRLQILLSHKHRNILLRLRDCELE